MFTRIPVVVIVGGDGGGVVVVVEFLNLCYLLYYY